MSMKAYGYLRAQLQRAIPRIERIGDRNRKAIEQFTLDVFTPGTPHHGTAAVMAEKLKEVPFSEAVISARRKWPGSVIELAKVLHVSLGEKHYRNIEDWIEPRVWSQSYIRTVRETEEEYASGSAYHTNRFESTRSMIPSQVSLIIEAGCGSAAVPLQYISLEEYSSVRAIGFDPSKAGKSNSIMGLRHHAKKNPASRLAERFSYHTTGIPTDKELDRGEWGREYSIPADGLRFVFSHGVLEHFEPETRRMFLRNNALLAGAGNYVMVGVPNRMSPSEILRLRSYGIGMENTTDENIKAWVPFNLFRYEVPMDIPQLLSLMKGCGMTDFVVTSYSPFKHFQKGKEGFRYFDNTRIHHKNAKRKHHISNIRGINSMIKVAAELDVFVGYFDRFFNGELPLSEPYVKYFFEDLGRYGYQGLRDHLDGTLGTRAGGLEYKTAVERYFSELAHARVRILNLYSTLFGCMIMARGMVSRRDTQILA